MITSLKRIVTSHPELAAAITAAATVNGLLFWAPRNAWYQAGGCRSLGTWAAIIVAVGVVGSVSYMSEIDGWTPGAISAVTFAVTEVHLLFIPGLWGAYAAFPLAVDGFAVIAFIVLCGLRMKGELCRQNPTADHVRWHRAA